MFFFTLFSLLQNHLAQPAGFFMYQNRTDKRRLVFWTTADSDQPKQFSVLSEKFLMAVTVNKNSNPDLLMEDPKYVLKEHPPRTKSQQPESIQSAEKQTDS